VAFNHMGGIKMLDTTTLDNRIATLLAGDTTTLAQAASANYVVLVVNPFTPAPNTDFTGLTEATFTGYAALAAGLNAQVVYFDPITGTRVVEIIPPVGGWQYTSSADTSPPQVVYGFCLVNHAKAVTYGSQLLPAPVTIAHNGDGVNLGAVQFKLTPNAMQ
jgi:hypothetical protein